MPTPTPTPLPVRGDPHLYDPRLLATPIPAHVNRKPKPKAPRKALTAAEQDAILVAADRALDDSDLTPEQKARAKDKLWAPFLKRMRDERQDGV
jgi:hypothetical protein